MLSLHLSEGDCFAISKNEIARNDMANRHEKLSLRGALSATKQSPPFTQRIRTHDPQHRRLDPSVQEIASRF